MSACGATVITLPALVALVVLFFWTIMTGSRNNANGNGEYRPWWDLDFRPEEVEAAKILVVLVVLIIACGTLFVPINKVGSGVYERFNVGVLAASMFMFGNMLIVTFWYFVNFSGRGQNYNGYNRYGYNPYWAMDEQELLVYHEKVVCYVALALGLAFLVVSAGIYSTSENLPLTVVGGGIQTQAHLIAETQFHALGESWSLLSLCNIVVFLSLFIAALLSLGGEDIERMVEEARLINLITVLLSVGLVSTFMLWRGQSIFNDQRGDGLGVGMMYGGTKYFAALLLLVCICFANLFFDERQRDETLWVATATSLACFFLSLMHFAFSVRARRCQINIYEAHSEQATKLDAQTEMVRELGGDFVRVDEPGRQEVA